MIRFPEASAGIREGTPPVLTDVFALITQLGDVVVLVTVLFLLYWLDDRESTGTVIAYTLVGLAVVLTLKEWLALGRPPAAVRAVPVEPDSHGFPSGHAIAATVVYGGLLVTRGHLRDRRYALATVILIGLVGLSRIVIGVHYVGDVVVGFTTGLVVLGGLWMTVRHRAELACLIAALIAVAAVVVTGGGTYALLGLGGSLGGAVAFWTVDRTALPTPEGAAQAAVLVILGFAFVGGTFLIAWSVDIAALQIVFNGLLVGGIVVLPKILDTSLLVAVAPD